MKAYLNLNQFYDALSVLSYLKDKKEIKIYHFENDLKYIINNMIYMGFFLIHITKK